MKKLDKFQAENHKDIKSIDENAQTSFKGGKLFIKNIFGLDTPIKAVGQRPNKFADMKVFSSFAELRASMFGGK